MRFNLRSAARYLAAFAVLNSAAFTESKAQTPKTYTSSEILLGLKKLNVLGSVLYIAAHPDDENTRLIAYLANERLLETGYLSCTRGDGGQNLIGPELREGLGVIRTQELLAARRTDGGQQFFTRANDFGFSKTPEETFRIWDKEQVLADMVWVIRQRRPDVLITRFPTDGRGGHGHHTASAILAAEAFDAAGDPKRFPEQLKYVQAWQPKRLFWNSGSFFVKPGENMDGYLKLDAGGYNPLLGQSYGEIAARSRSNHRSQGFGSAATRGEALEYFQPLKGTPAKTDLFEGIDQTWKRVSGGTAIENAVGELIRKYDASNPSASVAGLFKLNELVKQLLQAKQTPSKTPDVGATREQKMILIEKSREVQKLIAACLGLSITATAAEPLVVAGQKMSVAIVVLNRSQKEITLKRVSGFMTMFDTVMQKPLLTGKAISFTAGLTINKKVGTSQPYWLRLPSSVGMYQLPDSVLVAEIMSKSMSTSASSNGVPQKPSIQVSRNFLKPTRQELIGMPENESNASVLASMEVEGQQYSLYVPVLYKHTDPVLGELYQPLAVVPPVMVNLPPARSYVFADNKPKTVPVTLRAGRAGVSGNLALALPAGWKSEPATVPFTLANKDQELTVDFQVQPSATAASGHSELRATATVEGQKYSRGIQPIVYPHIPTQFLFPEAVSPLVKVDLKRRGQNVAYLMGAGDEVPDALRQIGYNVTMVNPLELTAANLKKFDALVVGIRAYNTVDRLKSQQPEILKYIEQGGNVIVQYVVARGTVLPEIGPYPMKLSSDRVTVEDAPVTFLKPQHPLLNFPNKITEQDFKGWVQEQGLYYPSSWDPKYQTIISSGDPGEKPKESAILVADYGKGHYIYTGLSLFRELPAGVPGAFRLITNMISYGKEKVQ
ncbi:PIG-L family deacetylase [Hymenobacter arizonensis]|uniref:N-acetylglucosaminyl deacetylase, LmbE family n=1 Tax=Hymenobacter arizonensis TaxID=1227077 RepID=A0A1I5V6D7_HYMAR|nr:PIG-L family deacetylase [Hymenobacter arizonensis]SFQ03058.1 N-acetylglucosaminyl deacetylase, LmbE family [Hymenobacter arizonensis]